MDSRTLHCASLAALPDTAAQILSFAREHQLRCWTLSGPMGAGKTSFVKEVARQLGVEDTVQSPTFGIVNEYRLPDGRPLYHFDCYRLKNLEEAYNIGMEEYLDSEGYCLIEWPELVESLLPERSLALEISALGPEERNFTLYIHE